MLVLLQKIFSVSVVEKIVELVQLERMFAQYCVVAVIRGFIKLLVKRTISRHYFVTNTWTCLGSTLNMSAEKRC